MLGRTGGIPQGKIRVHVSNYQGNTQERINRLRKNVIINKIIPTSDFCRLLAKIAHSYSIALLGNNSFEPTLLDIILGKNTDFFDFIGGPDEITQLSIDKSQLHQISISYIYNHLNQTLPPIINAEIYLFSFLNMPLYQVIVGKSYKSLPKPLQSSGQ